jgi:hypothetical protein
MPRSPPQEMAPQVSAPESFVRILADYEDYPSDEKAEYSVCYFLEPGSVWVFVPVPDQATADSKLRDISSRSEGVLTVSIEIGPNAGRKSPVAWIAQRHQSEWRRIQGTEGADQYIGENW